MIQNENYILVSGFMVNELKLKGNELLIYAIIYGFSQTEGQTFSGSLRYLAEWTNSTKQGVLNALKSLVAKGLIEKKSTIENGVNKVEYRSTKFNGVLNKVDPPIQKSLMGGIKQSLPHNIDIDNIEDNIEDNIYNRRSKRPTVEEIQAYCDERNNGIDAQQFYDHYEAVGWRVGKNPMKDWRACVRTWERNNYSKPKKREKTFADMYREMKGQDAEY